MCNCYDHQCKECDTYIPIHLEDYDTDPDEIEVFCHRHIPESNVRIFKLTHKEDGLPKGFRIGIRSLTENAKKHEGGNHPNLVCAIRIKEKEVGDEIDL
jgi:hypothetical protein